MWGRGHGVDITLQISVRITRGLEMAEWKPTSYNVEGILDWWEIEEKARAPRNEEAEAISMARRNSIMNHGQRIDVIAGTARAGKEIEEPQGAIINSEPISEVLLSSLAVLRPGDVPRTWSRVEWRDGVTYGGAINSSRDIHLWGLGLKRLTRERDPDTMFSI